MDQRAGKDQVQGVRPSQREEGGGKKKEGGGKKQEGEGRREEKKDSRKQGRMERAESESTRSQKWKEEQLSLHGDRALT